MDRGDLSVWEVGVRCWVGYGFLPTQEQDIGVGSNDEMCRGCRGWAVREPPLREIGRGSRPRPFDKFRAGSIFPHDGEEERGGGDDSYARGFIEGRREGTGGFGY